MIKQYRLKLMDLTRKFFAILSIITVMISAYFCYLNFYLTDYIFTESDGDELLPLPTREYYGANLPLLPPCYESRELALCYDFSSFVIPTRITVGFKLNITLCIMYNFYQNQDLDLFLNKLYSPLFQDVIFMKNPE